jgi:hypothetical protein
MPGTKTAPDAGVAAPNAMTATLHLIDTSGDLYTDSLTMPGTITATQAENWAEAYQDASNASIYKISLLSEWIGDADPDNGVVAQRNSVKDGVNLLWKNLTTLRTETPRLIAPIEAVMQGNQDIPLLSATAFVALIAEIQAILTGSSLQSAQYTQRRERTNNPRIKA